MGMNRKTMRHKMLELSRRIYFDNHKTYEGFGKISCFYNGDWHPKYVEIQKFGGYKACWDSDVIRKLRNLVGM